jgi:hypothetical protein
MSQESNSDKRPSPEKSDVEIAAIEHANREFQQLLQNLKRAEKANQN